MPTLSYNTAVLKENWEVTEVSTNRIKQWCELVASEANLGVGYNTAIEVLKAIFPLYF